ncbi:MAG: radical SAM protein [Deferrisomatales bacterium]
MSGALKPGPGPGAPGGRAAFEKRLGEAWAVRRARFPDEIAFAVPGLVRYEGAAYANRRESFAAVSVTGARCALGCDHCRGKLLRGMLPVADAAELGELARALRRRGCRGILLTGGCDEGGRVPLGPFLPAVPAMKKLGLAVLAHTGGVGPHEARALAAAGVDQALLDVVGDRGTARAVYHLDRGLEDDLRSLACLTEAGVPVAPHVVVGLHYGQLRGEYRAVEAIGRLGAARLVLVALKPLPGTPMEGVPAPGADEVAALAAHARVANPEAWISFGCARPYGPDKGALERRLVDAGVNALAFPGDETVAYAARRGLRPRFVERCCSLG